jgi:hypothetical protein
MAHAQKTDFVLLHLKCDGTRAETRFRLSAKRTSPFKSARGASVQSTTGSRGVQLCVIVCVVFVHYVCFVFAVSCCGYVLVYFVCVCMCRHVYCDCVLVCLSM